MPICRLCSSKEADKKGSHIVPHFILKRIDNEADSKDRDKELGIVIKENYNDYYFGRKILPEKLEQIFGELTDEEIQNSKSIAIVDYLLCTSCESRIAQIESQYSKSLFNSSNKEFAFLFWISVLWRISVSRQFAFILKAKEEALLRNILDRHLKSNLNEIDLDAFKNDIRCLNVFYRLLRSFNYSDKEETILFCHPYYKHPYIIILDEFVFCFYFRGVHIKDVKQNFFGLEDHINKAHLNNVNSEEVIYSIDNIQFKEFINSVLYYMMEKRFKNYDYILNGIHKFLNGHGKHMPFQIKRAIYKRITDSEKKMGRKFTEEDFAKSIMEELKNYSNKPS